MQLARLALSFFCIVVASVVHLPEARGQASLADALAQSRDRLAVGEAPVVLGVRIEESLDGELWEIQLLDLNVNGGKRLLSFRDGKFLADRPAATWPFDKGASLPLRQAEMALPLADVRRGAYAVASGSGIQAAGLTFVLRRPANLSEAVWQVYYLNSKRNILGSAQFASSNGQVLGSEWTAIAFQSPSSQAGVATEPKPTAAQQSQAAQSGLKPTEPPQ